MGRRMNCQKKMKTQEEERKREHKSKREENISFLITATEQVYDQTA